MSNSKKVFVALMLAMAMVCFTGCFGFGHKGTNNEEEVATSNSNHEYVDLGLPSGTLWATCNVGAYEPNEHGYYLVWNDTEKLQKKYGWEKGWRTPTDAEWVELYKNTDCSRTTLNDVEGMLFKASSGKSIFLPAAGYIKAGSEWISDFESIGNYWSSSPYPQDSKCAIYFEFMIKDLYGDGKQHYNIDYARRKIGMSVRPVRSK